MSDQPASAMASVPAAGPTGGIGANGGAITARAGSYYRRARYFVCAMIFVFGLWFCYDGFVRYPAYNRLFDTLSADARVQQHMEKKYDAMGLLLQRAIGVTLPPIAILMLVWFCYRSRGEYRLERRTLFVPGHPPVPIDHITELDRSLWDRKGILVVHYALDGGKPAKLKLDDFVYERSGTDAIVAGLTKELFPEGVPEAAKPM